MRNIKILLKIFLISTLTITFLTKKIWGLQNKSLLNIKGTYRIRDEFFDNYNKRIYGTNKKENFILLRLRLELEFKFNNSFKIHSQIQDSEVIDPPFPDRSFARKNNPFHDPFDINEFYIEYWPVKKFCIKLGRQSLLFGDKRIFGPGDWGNTGRYRWDAIRLIYKTNTIQTNLILGRYIYHDPEIWPNKEVNNVSTFAIYNTFKRSTSLFDIFYVLKIDNRGIIKGEKGTGNLNSHNIGFRIKGKNNQWDYEIMFVKEFGKWARDVIDAYGETLALGYTFNTFWKPHIIFQYVMGSGDKNPDDGKHNTFSALYSGADTTLYGWMNLFFWKNLREYRVDCIFSPAKNLTFRTEYHYFSLDEKKDGWYSPGKLMRRDPTGFSGKSLGHEIDLIVHKKFNKSWDILGGYCFFIPGNFIKNTGPAKNAYWSFFQITFHF